MCHFDNVGLFCRLVAKSSHFENKGKINETILLTTLADFKFLGSWNFLTSHIRAFYIWFTCWFWRLRCSLRLAKCHVFNFLPYLSSKFVKINFPPLLELVLHKSLFWYWNIRSPFAKLHLLLFDQPLSQPPRSTNQTQTRRCIQENCSCSKCDFYLQQMYSTVKCLLDRWNLCSRN